MCILTAHVHVLWSAPSRPDDYYCNHCIRGKFKPGYAVLCVDTKVYPQCFPQHHNNWVELFNMHSTAYIYDNSCCGFV